MANTLVWPNSLPCPVFGSEFGSIDLGLETVEAESGLTRQYRRHNKLPGQHSMRLALNTFQAGRFLSFAQEAAGKSFNINLIMPSDPEQVAQTVSARFISKISYEPLAGAKRYYSFDLRIEQLTPADIDYGLYDFYAGEFDAYSQARENQINADLLT